MRLQIVAIEGEKENPFEEYLVGDGDAKQRMRQSCADNLSPSPACPQRHRWKLPAFMASKASWRMNLEDKD